MTGMFEFGKVFAAAGKYKYVIIAVFAGLILMSFPGGSAKKTETTDTQRIEFDVGAFEKRIENALAQSAGIGRCKVMLSLDSSPESVYAKEARQSRKESESGVVKEDDSDMKPSIMSEGSGRQSPIVVKEIYPGFRGALVICDGADEPSIKACVIESVSSLTGLGSDKISVIKMKN
ncbi:MAG: hypothetical protein IKU65_04965 [Oscillospiraceae bacterium]|nr:hypothetical protein [Oscillospiraceae bacterium]